MFEAQRERRFGSSNPERMKLAFWEAMVRGAEEARATEDDEREADGRGRNSRRR